MSRTILSLGALAALAFAGGVRADDINDTLEAATREAVAKVAPAVVKIETRGGTELIGQGQVRKGIGPTTGVVVAPDGYIISSAFNFANKPSDIFVHIPGRDERLVARQVATDQTRMLTLLKVEAEGLTVPEAYPRDQIRVGHWALSVGRTLSPEITDPPSVSVGIISATDRIWGKAIQTDAKVSPVNYGGPLVAMDGRVQGILVPASPQSEGATAGVEWYDSGIGFAIPMDDVFAALPRLKTGEDLTPGLLGITAKSQDQFGALPEVATVSPESAASRAGIQVGDIILEIDGRPVVNFAQVMHILKPKYSGETVSVKVKRGEDEMTFDGVTLASKLAALAAPFIGVLPIRDDPEPGVEVRFVYPESPADKAGIKAGDRIMGLAPAAAPRPAPFAGRDQLVALLGRLTPGTEVKVELKRAGADKAETVTLTLAELAVAAPEGEVPRESSKKRAREAPKAAGPMRPMPGRRPAEKPEEQPEEKPAEGAGQAEGKDDEKKAETGLIRHSTPGLKREYWAYVPENYDPDVSHGLIIWLHPSGKGGDDPKAMIDIWADFCWEHHYILLGPKSQNENWLASEMDFVIQHAQEIRDQYTIDPERVVAHGMGVGGQMAFYLGFNARDLVRGVATTGAVLNRDPKDAEGSQRLSFFIVAGEKDPLVKDIAEAGPNLREKKFPVHFKEVEAMGKEYLDVPTFRDLCRWLDALDRL